MGMNYSTILASLLDGISLALKSGNSNVDAEQFNFLTDAINKSTIIPSYFDRENAIKYLDVSDTEFARLTYKGTKFHPIQPLLSPVRVQGMTKPEKHWMLLKTTGLYVQRSQGVNTRLKTRQPHTHTL